MAIPSAAKTTIIIRPPKGWIALDLHELWEYRDLIWFLVMRNVKSHYRQTALGPLWIILKPIGNVAVFTFIFGTIAQVPTNSVPYPLFSYSGLLAWSYFAGAAGGAMGSLTDYMYLISKVYFPRLAVPLVAILTGLVDFVVSFLILLVMIFLYGYSPTIGILLIPFYLLFAMLTALAIGLWNAALVARYHDWRTVVGYGMQFWLYATPVAYASTAIPSRFETLYQINPLFWIVEGFRWGLIGTGKSPEPLMIVPILIVLVLLVSGLYVFRRTELNVVDWL